MRAILADCLYFCSVNTTVIMNECFGKKFVLNGELHPADLFDNTFVYEGDSVYEVIRMVKGIPVFFSRSYGTAGFKCKTTEKRDSCGCCYFEKGYHKPYQIGQEKGELI